jgi:transposase
VSSTPTAASPHARTISCPRTREYVTRRRADGRTTLESRRCLKRYISRELFRILTADMT